MTPRKATEDFTVIVNGRPRPLAGRALPEALTELGHDPARPGIAVAVNDEVVPRSRWSTTTLRSGDRVEIVGAAQGG